MSTTTFEKKIIPIFFAVDDRYAPYLAVAIRSLGENASAAYDYRIHILIDTLSEDTKRRLLTMEKDNLHIEFVAVKEQLRKFEGKLHLRDYYTQATYYRFFIPEMFPQYDRCIYLDCDILVLGDISEMYFANMENNLMAAVPDDVVANLSFFRDYVGKYLGVPYEQYFNAGILLLNLAEMRRVDIESAFIRLMSERKFPVAQDQDYLNVLCHGRMTYLDASWNQTAFPDAEEKGTPNIVHFKINFKPWHYDDISFGKHFWQYAEKTPFFADLHMIRAAYTDAEREKDAGQYDGLVALANAETEKVNEHYVVPTVFSVAVMTVKECF